MTSILNRSMSLLLQILVAASRRVFIFTILLATQAPAILDTNNNGLSDPWEKQYNHGQLFPPTFDPQGDPDGDGWTNKIEAAAGTDPLDANPPNGFLRPQIQFTPATYTNISGTPTLHTPEAVTLTWPSQIGKQYTLLFSPALTAGTWTPVGNPRTANGQEMGKGIPITQPDGSTPAEMFWKVAVTDIDTDGDTLTNYEEHILGTSPTSADSDGDGMRDDWEVKWGLNPSNPADATVDTDSDSVSNLREFQIGTNPTGTYRVEVLTLAANQYFHSAADDGSVVIQPTAVWDPTTTLHLISAPDANGNWTITPAPPHDWNPLATIAADLVANSILNPGDPLVSTGIHSSDGFYRIY